MKDTIYKQQAIDAALTFLVEYCGAAFDEDMQKMLYERLDALPSAQPEVTEEEVKEYCRKRCLCIVDSELLRKYASAKPERKNGKWNTYYHSDIGFSHSCNQCGYSAPYQMIGGEVFQKKWNYCPNCGADMRGE